MNRLNTSLGAREYREENTAAIFEPYKAKSTPATLIPAATIVRKSVDLMSKAHPNRLLMNSKPYKVASEMQRDITQGPTIFFSNTP